MVDAIPPIYWGGCAVGRFVVVVEVTLIDAVIMPWRSVFCGGVLQGGIDFAVNGVRIEKVCTYYRWSIYLSKLAVFNVIYVWMCKDVIIGLVVIE